MENRLAEIGSLDTLVTVQSCVIGRGTQGQKNYTFTTHSKVFAKITRLVDEAVDYDNLESGQSLTITMYKISEMTTRWRILVEGKPFGIRSIDPVSRYSPLCNVTVTAIDG